MSIVNLVKGSVTTALKFANAKSPELLALAAGGCLIGAVVTAVVATPKAMQDLKIEEQDMTVEEKQSGKPIPKGKRLWRIIKKCWKRYLWTALFVAGGIICIGAGYKVALDRQLTALGIASAATKELNDRIDAENKILSEKDRAALDKEFNDKSISRLGVVEERMIPHVGPSGNTLFMDYYSGRFFRSDGEWIKERLRDLNDNQLRVDRNERHCETSLNDWYRFIGLPTLPDFDQRVFDVNSDDYAELDWGEAKMMGNEPVGIVKFRIGPKWDFRRDYD